MHYASKIASTELLHIFHTAVYILISTDLALTNYYPPLLYLVCFLVRNWPRSTESPSCMSDSLLAMVMTAYLWYRHKQHVYQFIFQFKHKNCFMLTSDVKWLPLCRTQFLFCGHSHTVALPVEGLIKQV